MKYYTTNVGLDDERPGVANFNTAFALNYIIKNGGVRIPPEQKWFKWADERPLANNQPYMIYHIPKINAVAILCTSEKGKNVLVISGPRKKSIDDFMDEVQQASIQEFNKHL